MAHDDMRSPDAGPQPGGGLDPLGLLYLAASGHAACVLVFTRRAFGVEAFRRSGPAGLAIIIVYGGYTGDYVMFLFLLAWLAMLIVRRAESAWLRRAGRREHSRYSGWPWLATRLPLARSERRAKEFWEPFLCLVGGGLAAALSPHLGLFVALGFVSVLVKEGMDRMASDARVQAMWDAEIEHRHLADRFHGGFDER